MSRHGPRSKRLLLGPTHVAPTARKGGCCLLTLFLIPLLPLILLTRHRATREQPPRPDPHPDRIGAHAETPFPFRREQVPAATLLARLRASKETPS